MMPFPYRVPVAWIQSNGTLKGAPDNAAALLHMWHVFVCPYKTISTGTHMYPGGS
jgi:hypothetical protein